MNARELKARRTHTAAEMREAVEAAIEAGAIGFHFVWLLDGHEYGDAYDSDDLLAMTEVVNTSALTARILQHRSQKA